MTEQDTKRKWQEDPEASQIFDAAKKPAGDRPPLFCYAVSESAAEAIADIAATLGASRLILGAPRRTARQHFARQSRARSLRLVAGGNRFAGLRIRCSLAVLHVRKSNLEFVTNKQHQDRTQSGENKTGGMKTLVAWRHKHMSNGASDDGANDSQYNRPEDSEMSVHDRLGDDARD